jgi:predicted glycoside hydrolase/deacetylase ChbG (UPF0249 family)
VRGLIINADDFGERRFNASIEEGFDQGFVTSTTLLVGRAGAGDAALRAQRGGLEVGLHLNLTAGEPVADATRVPTLVGPDGQFLGEAAFREALGAGAVDPCDIARESVGQLARFNELIGVPTHIDGHHHIHVEPPIAAVLAPLLAKQSIRRIRMPIEEHVDYAHIEPHRRAWADRLMLSARESAQHYAAHGCRWPVAFAGMGLGWKDCSYDRLRDRLARLPPSGIAEYMVHIVRKDAVPPSDSGYQRHHEYDTLASPGFRQILTGLDIALVSFRDL